MTNLEQRSTPPTCVGQMPHLSRLGATASAAAQDLHAKLAAEARQYRVCDTCGFERQYRRVWRQTFDTFVGGRVAGPDYLRGEMRLICLGCQPEFVLNPYEGNRP